MSVKRIAAALLLVAATSCTTELLEPGGPSMTGTWKDRDLTLVLSQSRTSVSGTGAANVNNPPNGLQIEGTNNGTNVSLTITWTNNGDTEQFVGSFRDANTIVGTLNSQPDTLRRQ